MERADWLHAGLEAAQARFLMVTAITHHWFSSPAWGAAEVRKLHAELAEIEAAVVSAIPGLATHASRSTPGRPGVLRRIRPAARPLTAGPALPAGPPLMARYAATSAALPFPVMRPAGQLPVSRLLLRVGRRLRSFFRIRRPDGIASRY
ncbi:MAG: hypothetical protein JO345_11370 [Streptosporangiaceae bacterium]|nr:hypothetical protein [Streptosporangiaceae bacterium]